MIGISTKGYCKRACCQTLTAAVIPLAALLALPVHAQAEPAQNCAPPPDDVMIAGQAGEPYAAQVTCQNPDGSYTVCNPTGAPGTGPADCTNYPPPPPLPPA